MMAATLRIALGWWGGDLWVKEGESVADGWWKALWDVVVDDVLEYIKYIGKRFEFSITYKNLHIYLYKLHGTYSIGIPS